jgi:hypothetical protein
MGLKRRKVWWTSAIGMSLLGAALSGCGSSAPTSTTHRAAAAKVSPPETVTARPLGPRQGILTIRRGTVVRSNDLSVRVFLDGRRGFALADLEHGETYPAATVDGGKTWRIDGPVFHIPAANGPAVVTLVGAARPRTYFAFGGGGSVVDLTTDGGVHWWSAFLGDDVLSVVPGTNPHHLIAVVQNGGPKVATVVYISTDGGRHWRRSDHYAY